MKITMLDGCTYSIRPYARGTPMQDGRTPLWTVLVQSDYGPLAGITGSPVIAGYIACDPAATHEQVVAGEVLPVFFIYGPLGSPLNGQPMWAKPEDALLAIARDAEIAAHLPAPEDWIVP
jgi:hypothetical protein